MLVIWIVISAFSLILFAFAFAKENSLIIKLAFIIYAVFVILSFVTTYVLKTQLLLQLIIIPIGVGITIGIIMQDLLISKEDVKSCLKHVASGLVATIVVSLVWGAIVSESCIGVTRDAEVKKDIIVETTINNDNTQKRSYSTSSNSGTHTGTNKRRVDPNHVYWVQSGEVYHSWDGCSSLRNSANIYEGTITQALESGKNRGCKLCCD